MQKVYFFIGTKAQAIKCISLIESLSEIKSLSVKIVNSGQHIQITENIFNRIGNKVEYIYLNSNKDNISDYLVGIRWFLKLFFLIIISKKKKNTSKKDICFIHGDTASTLLGLLWSKKNGFHTIHLESGLTSNNILNPFPEEIIRNIVSRFSNILISFDRMSAIKLENKYNRKTIIEISENTILEELKHHNLSNTKDRDKVTVTLHRTENILSKNRMKDFIDLIETISKEYEVNWFCHEPTINSIKKFNLKLNKSINLKPLVNHDQFIKELIESKLVITDCGSIQEECFYLNKLTILWRKKTERPHALNSNIFLSDFKIKESMDFINNNISEDYIIKPLDSSPAKEIIDKLFKLNIIDK